MAMDSLNNSIDSDFGSEQSLYSSVDSPQEHVPDKKLTNLEPMVPESGGNDYKSWIYIHPTEWSNDEVLDFLYFYAHKREIDLNDVRGEAFQDLTGEHLSQMSKEQFQSCDSKYGEMFYECFTELIQRAHYVPPPTGVYTDYSDAMMADCSSPGGNPTLGYLEDLESPMTECETFENSDASQFHEMETLPNIANITIGKEIFNYPIDHEDKFADIFTHNAPVDGGYESGGSNEPSPVTPGPRFPGTEYSHYNNTMHHHSNEYCSKYDDYSYSVYSFPNVKEEPHSSSTCSLQRSQSSPKPTGQKRAPGRPRKQQRNSESDDQGFVDMKPTSTRGRKAGQTSKGNHLWEFVRDMLKDSDCNPRLVRWENQDMGVFKFVKSDEVAKRWGKKKNNHTMNYEKLSRAMRFCRKAGYFAELPKDGNYPKKLCFKFGAKAEGWSK